MITRYIPNLIECFERVKDRITAPLEALQAIADSGEAMAVAPAATRVQAMVLSMNSRGRMAACSLLTSIFRGGGGKSIYRAVIHSGHDDQIRSNSENDRSLLRALLLIV